MNAAAAAAVDGDVEDEDTEIWNFGHVLRVYVLIAFGMTDANAITLNALDGLFSNLE